MHSISVNYISLCAPEKNAIAACTEIPRYFTFKARQSDSIFSCGSVDIMGIYVMQAYPEPLGCMQQPKPVLPALTVFLHTYQAITCNALKDILEHW